jgi:DNA-directed RNA polymerase subunit RPC12/RpoP
MTTETDLSDYLNPEDDLECPYCGFDGWITIDSNWDSDPINGSYDGEIIQCPYCGGSGLAER